MANYNAQWHGFAQICWSYTIQELGSVHLLGKKIDGILIRDVPFLIRCSISMRNLLSNSLVELVIRNVH